MEQLAHNACGTIGTFHALLNNLDKGIVKKGTFLEKFFNDTFKMNPVEKSKFFEKCEELKKKHVEAVNEGQGSVKHECDSHFICFTEKNKKLICYDGLYKTPFIVADTTPDTILEDSCKVCKLFMASEPENISFTMVPLCTGSTELE